MRASRISGWFVILPVLTALAAQAILMLSVQYLEYDEAIYMDIARNIRGTGLPLRSIGEDGVPRLEHTPLYMYILAGIQCFLPESVLIARLIATLFSVGCLVGSRARKG